MADSSPHSRISRTRRAIALMAWGCLICSAFLLWNGRQTGVLTAGTNPIAASLLAAFAAFVGVFAWMLFNPNQRRSSDSPSLFMAAGATLFPPPMIAFCLISSDSPLRWWTALGIFLLVVIGILSHVPDEFFGVPRGRSSYFVPLPIFDRVANGILDPNASWFQFNDLSDIVPDQNRPSLAPKAYLNTDSTTRSSATGTAYSPARPPSEVDDILGTDFELGLLDDSLMDFELSEFSSPEAEQTEPQPPAQQRTTANRSQPRRIPVPDRRTHDSGSAYSRHNPESLRLLGARAVGTRPASRRRAVSRAQRHAASLKTETSQQHRTSFNQQTDASRSRSPQSTRFTESTTNRTARSEPQRPQAGSPPRPQRTETKKPRTDSVPAQRSPQSDQHVPTGPAAYLQETNQRRSDRHRDSTLQTDKQSHERSNDADRLAAEDNVVHQSQYGTTRKADQRRQGEDRTRSSEASSLYSQDTTTRQPPPPAGKTKTGASLFGIPMPFGSRAAEPEPPVVTPNRTEATLTESRRRKSRYDDESTQNPGSRRLDQGTQSITPAIPPVAEHRHAGPEPADIRQEPRQPQHKETQERQRPPETRRSETPAARRAAESEVSEEHFERTKDEHGSELVEGVMMIRFDKGQKRANLHIPFSPPLPGMPEVECECVGDVPLRLKVPVKQSYGIRIEARRTDASDDLETQVGFAAVYTPE